STGASTTSAVQATVRSKSRLATADDPPDGLERLGCFQAVDVAPGSRPVLQRPQRTRVRVVAHLALVTRHRFELPLQGRRDVDPGVRSETARVGPLGAARGVEGVYGLDVALRRSRGDE